MEPLCSTRLDFKVFFLLDWLSTKSREPGLLRNQQLKMLKVSVRTERNWLSQDLNSTRGLHFQRRQLLHRRHILCRKKITLPTK